MESLFEQHAAAEVIRRIESLEPGAKRVWGKMNVAQMLSHCSASLEVAMGLHFPKRRLLGVFLGPLIKSFYYSKRHHRRNSPTDASLIVRGPRDFNMEKDRLLHLIRQFVKGGENQCTKHPHSFFGELTPKEWGIGMYKHLDHHLRQFSS